MLVVNAYLWLNAVVKCVLLEIYSSNKASSVKSLSGTTYG